MPSLPRIGRALYWFFSFVVVVLAFRWVPTGVEKAIPAMAYHLGKRDIYLYTHMMASAVPMALIPFQVSARFRARHLRLHRWMGWAALAGIYVGGLALFPLAAAQPLPAWGRAGFMVSGVIWLTAASIGLWFLLVRRDIRRHRWWMLITAAVIFGAVTQRLMLPVWIGTGQPFKVAYSLSAWSAWPINLSLFFAWQYRAKLRALLAFQVVRAR